MKEASVDESGRRDRIVAKLRAEFDPVHVDVVDESHLHVGHAGARSGAGHFRVTLVSSRFEGVGRIERQRFVFGALTDEIGPEIHALSIKALSPSEWSD